MKIIIHAGMHKTGSSSIQETLFRNEFRDLTYAPWSNSNHSGLFVLLYHEFPEKHHGFRKNGATAASLQKQREEWRAQLDQALDSDVKTLVFSAEDIAAALPANPDAQKRMVADLSRVSKDIQVIAYIRPPAGYMQSAFQQGVKAGNLASLDIERLWPNYRQRFEPILENFGEDRVEFRAFDRNTMTQGDVVKDFFSSLDVELLPDQIIRANESLSLEALSLIFAQRRLGHGLITGFPRAMFANAIFTRQLGQFGNGKLRFARDVLLPVFEKNMEDLAWMEDKLGREINDLPDADTDTVVASEEDLLAIAETQAEALRSHLADTLKSDEINPNRAALVRDLDLLYLNGIARTFDPMAKKNA